MLYLIMNKDLIEVLKGKVPDIIIWIVLIIVAIVVMQKENEWQVQQIVDGRENLIVVEDTCISKYDSIEDRYRDIDDKYEDIIQRLVRIETKLE